ncbi:MAG: tRNA (adenosine(37)-N6)-threonylcarbamoyltransferase complex transferase subunit TsaD, partial [Bdellovibrio sp.]|nr:tRNA (adenosine(37)-N6)-threonylcarbamoyltransferase complex transferase subunit TsaD [Bdellovibrio sp.]
MHYSNIKVLGIETSCDECSASVVQEHQGDLSVLSLVTFSQIKIHKPYGGVVPEIASRNHLETIQNIIAKAMQKANMQFSELSAIAVTNRPGLIGSLLVGVSAAKSLSYVFEKPLLSIHHLEGHATSLFLDAKTDHQIKYQMLLGIISGGHTNLYLVHESPEHWSKDFLKTRLIGCSRDDAAGEAFDKIAKLMGFPYPGGIYLDRNAQGGDPNRFSFPRALAQKTHYDFSFSGLKTAAALEIQKQKVQGVFNKNKKDLCASVQEAIIDTILRKIYLAVQNFNCKTIALGGGVAANSRLRERLANE